MIELHEYFGEKQHTDEQEEAAAALLDKVNACIEWARLGGFMSPVCHNTGTQISGSKGGAGDGGFRLQGSSTGKAASKHKLGHAVDVYDPGDVLDHILSDADLVRFGLWRESQEHTPGWTHLQDVPPTSGKRTFIP